MMKLHRAFFLTLGLLVGIIAPQATLGDEAVFGYAQTNRHYADGWSGVRFDIKTPFFPVEDVLISASLKIRVSEGQIPEHAVCSLRRDFRHVPADLHSLAGEDGGLGLGFERLEPYTHLQLLIAWENKHGQIAYPHSASIRATGTEWKRLSNRTFNYLSMEPEGTPVQIVIDGPEDCRLL
ncbi:MAG: hypothetical protein AB2535_20960 [Candidatus Thiodiazotropha endolucinida]